MRQRVNVQLNGTLVSDALHSEVGQDPGVAKWLDTLEEKGSPYGAVNQSRAWLVAPTNPHYPGHASTDFGSHATITAGVAAGSADFASGLAGVTNGQAGPLEGFAWADEPFGIPGIAGRHNAANYGENEIKVSSPAGRCTASLSAAMPAPRR